MFFWREFSGPPKNWTRNSHMLGDGAFERRQADLSESSIKSKFRRVEQEISSAENWPKILNHQKSTKTNENPIDSRKKKHVNNLIKNK